jgi:hypothetical protein
LRAASITPYRLLACAAIGAGLCGVGLALAGVTSPLRSPLVLLFLIAAPLLAVAGLLRGMDMFARIFASCAAMIVINVCVAETMLAAGVWSPRGALVAIVVITAVLGLVQLPALRGWTRRYAPALRAVIQRLERM